MYNPKVAMPNLSNNIPPMRSAGFQPPFYFGGSQVPNDLHLKKGSFSGSGMRQTRDVRMDEQPITRSKISPVVHMSGMKNKKAFIPVSK